jgi:hypothetical protein
LANDDTFHAFLWEAGSPMIDLDVFVPEGSSLQQLTDAFNINERGEILGVGVPPGISPEDVEFGGHVFLLVPNGECDDECQASIAIRQNKIAAAPQIVSRRDPAIRTTAPAEAIERLRAQIRKRLHLQGQSTMTPD